MYYRTINFIRHILNRVLAQVLTFIGLMPYMLDLKYYPTYPDVTLTAVVHLPDTRFAEIVCERKGYKPLRFQVGKLDAGTEVLAISFNTISFRVSGKEWTSDICDFAAGLHFCKA